MSDKVELPTAAGPEIADPHNVPIIFSDGVITSGCHDNVVNVTLGVLDYATRGSNGEPRAVVVCQLRFSRAGAEGLRRALTAALAVGPEGAPGASEPQTVPRNQMN
jgi:hypothetical protein